MAGRRERGLLPEPRESDVIAVAREIGRLCDEAAGQSRTTRASDLVMKLAMRMPRFQTELFRFVDVFPAMTGDADTARHLVEYLGDGGAPAGIGSGLKVITSLPLGKRAVATMARREITRIASQFIVSTDAAGTAEVLGRMWRDGSAATVDLLGEHTVSDAEADAYADRLATLCRVVGEASAAWPSNELLERDSSGHLGRTAVSVKPSALAPDFAPLTSASGIDGAKRRLRPILLDAAASGTQVYFDMERYEAKDLTERLFKELLDEPELSSLRAGIVVQAYLRDSLESLQGLLEWASRRPTPIAVRLVKGAYWDTETIVNEAAGWPIPVFADKAETDLNYERCARALLAAAGRVRPAFGTHNLRSLAYAIAVSRDAGLSPADFEVQLLYGMAEPVHEAVRRLGLRLRVYAPMGELVPGMAYLVRRLLENTSNDSFVRLRFTEGLDVDRLVKKPSLPRQASKPDGRRRPSRRRQESSPRSAGRPREPGSYHPEPAARWYTASARQMMGEAISRLSGTDRFVPAYIDGERVQTSRTIRSANPAQPASTVATAACAGARELHEALDACDRAFGSWSRLSMRKRAGIMSRAASYLREHRFEIAALETMEAGKGWADSDGDVCEAIDYLEYYAREALRIESGGAVQSPPGETNRLDYRARGVVGVISPWNFPLAIPTGMTAAALVTGNTVVLKPAEQTPAVASVLVDAFAAAGLPGGVLALLPGYGEEIGEALVNDERVVAIAFTGSRAVGLHINEAAAHTRPGQREVRRVIVEMGGKNAVIVDSDADLDVAVPAAVESAFGFAGQRCSAASRFVVLDSVHDAFLERFCEATRSLSIGPPAAMGTQLGPVIDEDALSRIREWQGRAGSYGRVALQRDDLPESGFFVGPTIVDDADPESPLWHEEIFGPVAAVTRAANFDAAIALANTGEYGLTAGVVSRSPAHIRRAAEELAAGNVYVNRAIVGAVVGRQPFGGHKMSGFGQKAGGPDYLMQFLMPKVVTENTLRQGFAPLG